VAPKDTEQSVPVDSSLRRFVRLPLSECHLSGVSGGTGTALPETSSGMSADTQYIDASGRHLAVGYRYPRTGQLFQICFFDTTNPLGASPSRASMVELDAPTQQRQHHKCKYRVEYPHSNPPPLPPQLPLKNLQSTPIEATPCYLAESIRLASRCRCCRSATPTPRLARQGHHRSIPCVDRWLPPTEAPSFRERCSTARV